MRKKQFNVGLATLAAVVGLSLVMGVLAACQPDEPEARGIQHFGDATFSGAVNALRGVTVTENITAGGVLRIGGRSYFLGDVWMEDPLQVADGITVTQGISVGGVIQAMDGITVAGGITVGESIWVGGDITATQNITVGRGITVVGNSRFGDAITDFVLLGGVVRTYDGTDYIQDIVVSDVPGSANNGAQFAYNITDWDGETSFFALFAETKMITPTVVSGTGFYGGDFMARLEGTVNDLDVYHATNSTGIGVYAEVQAVYTSALPTAYAVYGELEAASGSTITDSSVFYADLIGSGTFGTVDVLAVRGDTWDYGIDFGSATAMTADFRFQNGTELEEVTDTVLTFSEFLAAEEQTPLALGADHPITPTGTYMPLTSAAAISTHATTAIVDGTVNGQLLIITNENGTDAITIIDNANTKLGGNKVLTGGEGDAIFLMWDGADWICIGYNDN